MDVCNMENDKILANMNEIDENMQTLDNFEEDINIKESDITSLITKLKKKNFLDLEDSLTNLSFQQSILRNEKQYATGLRKIFLEKIYNDMYSLAENILMFVGSIDTIEFEDNKDKKVQKIANIKNITYENLNIKNLSNLVNSVNNNLCIIKNNIDNFEKYIDETNKTITDNNFHCKMFKTNLMNQRQHIIIEYNKFVNQLNKIVEYYLDFSKHISDQLSSQKIIDFCLKKSLKSKES
tara:strand:- start:317 stop:1030 length:714 start_codon:yes stop_codon:yes gene_type:complete